MIQFDTTRYIYSLMAERKKEHAVRIRCMKKIAAGCGNQSIETYAGLLEKQIFEQNQFIIREGQIDKYLYIIAEGECNVLLNLPSIENDSAFLVLIRPIYKFIVIDHLYKGEIFGEIGAVSGTPSPYSIQAKSDQVKVYKLDRAALK